MRGYDLSGTMSYNAVPYTIRLVETESRKNGRNFYQFGKDVVTAGMPFPAKTTFLFPAKNKTNNGIKITMCEDGVDDSSCKTVVSFTVDLEPQWRNDPNFRLICEFEYRNVNLMHIVIKHGSAGFVFADKYVYIKRNIIADNNIELLERSAVNADKCDKVPYEIGFVRYRNYKKVGDDYLGDGTRCEPYFETAITSGRSFPVIVSGKTCSDGSFSNIDIPDIELAERTPDKASFERLRIVSLKNTPLKDKTIVDYRLVYEDINTLFLIVTEMKKQFLKKELMTSVYVFDMQREVVQTAKAAEMKREMQGGAIPQNSESGGNGGNSDKLPDKHPSNKKDSIDTKGYTPKLFQDGDFSTYDVDEWNRYQAQKKHREEKEEACQKAMAELDAMVGFDEVKEQVHLIYNNIKYEIERAKMLGTKMDLNCPRYMFVGNPGTGKTTVARIVANILKNTDYLSKGHLVEASKRDLVSEYIGATASKTQALCESARGGVLFVDEAYELANGGEKDHGREAITQLLTEMENHRKDFVVIFAGYDDTLEKLSKVNQGFGSRITNVISFRDYNEEELCEIAKKMADADKYSISEDGLKAFGIAIDKKRYNKQFGNAREVRNILSNATKMHGERYMKDNSISLTELTPEDFGVNLQRDIKKSVDEYWKELDMMVGLTSVKKSVRDTVNMAKYIMDDVAEGYESPDKLNSLNMNICFIGNPGTGKTTVARLYSKILHAIGFTKTDAFIEANREKLVAGYLGQSATKTKELCESAYGGVLFIDEAYDLVHGENDAFGLEALTALIKEMEDNRDKLTVILAGYTEEMNVLFGHNPGLLSRIPAVIEFEDYTAEELRVIFNQLIEKDRLEYTAEADILINSKIEHMVLTKTKKFGNGRDVRNMYGTIKGNMMSRAVEKGLTGSEKRLITADDIEEI